jgi:CRISPR/Cas system-associated exonuclease Cas4 (RecB family)
MIEERTSTRDWASTLRISKTHMQTYLMCPRKFYFQYVIGAPWEFTPPSLSFGRALHEAVAFFYKTLKREQAQPDLTLLISAFKAAWHTETAGRDVAFASGSKESMEGLGMALLKSFYEQVRPRRIEAVEYPFSVTLFDPDGGRPLDFNLVGIIDLIESDEDGHLIISELKTSSKRYADSQGENQLDGLIYAYAMDQLGFRTTDDRTLIRCDVLVKTKTPTFQQAYFNKEAGDYRRLTRWIKDILSALDRGAFYPNFGWGCKQCQFRKQCWSL